MSSGALVKIQRRSLVVVATVTAVLAWLFFLGGSGFDPTPVDSIVANDASLPAQPLLTSHSSLTLGSQHHVFAPSSVPPRGSLLERVIETNLAKYFLRRENEDFFHGLEMVGDLSHVAPLSTGASVLQSVDPTWAEIAQSGLLHPTPLKNRNHDNTAAESSDLSTAVDPMDSTLISAANNISASSAMLALRCAVSCLLPADDFECAGFYQTSSGCILKRVISLSAVSVHYPSSPPSSNRTTVAISYVRRLDRNLAFTRYHLPLGPHVRRGSSSLPSIGCSAPAAGSAQENVAGNESNSGKGVSADVTVDVLFAVLATARRFLFRDRLVPALATWLCDEPAVMIFEDEGEAKTQWESLFRRADGAPRGGLESRSSNDASLPSEGGSTPTRVPARCLRQKDAVFVAEPRNGTARGENGAWKDIVAVRDACGRLSPRASNAPFSDGSTAPPRWVVVVDDDTVMIPSNLRFLLRFVVERRLGVDPIRRPVMLGADYVEGAIRFAHGGSGVAFSRAACARLATFTTEGPGVIGGGAATCGGRCRQQYGDVRLGCCAAFSGVQMLALPGFHYNVAFSSLSPLSAVPIVRSSERYLEAEKSTGDSRADVSLPALTPPQAVTTLGFPFSMHPIRSPERMHSLFLVAACWRPWAHEQQQIQQQQQQLYHVCNNKTTGGDTKRRCAKHYRMFGDLWKRHCGEVVGGEDGGERLHVESSCYFLTAGVQSAGRLIPWSAFERSGGVFNVG